MSFSAVVAGLAVTCTLHSCTAQSQYPPQPWPLEVLAQVQIIELGELNAVSQSFYADFYITLLWRDDAFNAADLATMDSSNCPASIEFTNRLVKEAINLEWSYMEGLYGVPPSQWPESASRDPLAKWWSAYTRVAGTFTATLMVADFPMDKQQIMVKMESPFWNRTYVRFRGLEAAREYVIPEHLSIVEWFIDGSVMKEFGNYYSTYAETYSEFSFGAVVTRQSEP